MKSLFFPRNEEARPGKLMKRVASIDDGQGVVSVTKG